MIAALTSGEILAAYRDDLEIRKVLDAVPSGGLALKPMYFTDLTDPIAVAVKFDNIQLLSRVNIFLELQPTDMTSEESLNRYKEK